MTLETVENVVGIILAAIFCLVIGIGIFLNVVIVILNLNCWKKSRPFQAIDLIIISLAMVRIILLLLYTLFIIEDLFGQTITQMYKFPEYTFTLALSVEFCSLWWGSVLCVFYCVKITNYCNRLFMKVKMNISKMVPWLLLISIVPSFLCSLPYRWVVFHVQSFNVTDDGTELIKKKWFSYLMIRLGGSILPFLISCISIGLLIESLLRHTRHLGSRSSGFSDAQRDIHLSVIGNMVCFLLLYVVYFLGSNLLPLSIIFKIPLLTMLCLLFYVVFPTIHSVSLIVSNRELKNAVLTLLRCSCVRPHSHDSTVFHGSDTH